MKNRIREFREAEGLTQEELAARLSEPTTKSTISKLESGEQKLDQIYLEMMAPIFNCEPSDIISDRLPYRPSIKRRAKKLFESRTSPHSTEKNWKSAKSMTPFPVSKAAQPHVDSYDVLSEALRLYEMMPKKNRAIFKRVLEELDETEKS